MSVMGVAPRIVLDGPLPRPPLFGLSSAAQSVGGDEPHWRAGANLYPYPPDLPSANDPCAAGTFRDKATPTGVTLPEGFPTFTAYLGEICTAASVGDWDEFKGRAESALRARDGWALERQLVAADFVDAPHLGDDNVDVLASGAPVAAAVAIAYLEEALAATAQDGLIHLTAAVAAFLGGDYLVNDRGVLRTYRGTTVVVGTGYSDADVPTPSGTPGSTPAAGQSWIYVSGPVLYRKDPNIFSLPEDESEALDRSDNTVIYRAERDLWVAWDGQLQAAVLADWSP